MQIQLDSRLGCHIRFAWSPHQALPLPLRRGCCCQWSPHSTLIQVIEQEWIHDGVVLPLGMADRESPRCLGQVLAVSGPRLHVGDKYVQLCVLRTPGVPRRTTTRCVAHPMQEPDRLSIPPVSHLAVSRCNSRNESLGVYESPALL